jgi:Trypsin
MGRPIGPGALTRRTGRIHLRIDFLEDRANPAGFVIGSDIYYPTVVAGDPLGIPADSPDQRVDPNTKDSPFGGVGAIQVTSGRGSFIGTGSALDRRHVLTAAHVLDINNDGNFNRQDKTTGSYFIINWGGNRTARIAISRVTVHPDYNGFGNSINDDIAILTLARDLPLGVPTYDLPDGEITQGMVVTFVGYGRSGDGVHGYNTPASYTVKRVGANTADAFYGQDDPGRPEANEVFRFDFDGPDGNGPMGGPTLGNEVETTLGAGDSGCPAFASTESGLALYGMGTFVQGSNAPMFGSLGGGVNLFWYLDWINSVLHPGTSGGLPLPVPTTPGLLGPPEWGIVAVRGELSAPPSSATESSASFAGLPSFNSESDDQELSAPIGGDSLLPTPPTHDQTRVLDQPLEVTSLLSVDTGLIEMVSTGGFSLPSDE